MSEAGRNHGEPGRAGMEHSIRPGAAVPSTLLIAEMRDGGLFLQGWRDGPVAYVVAGETGALRRALAAAFGADGEAPCVPGGDAERASAS